MSAAGDKNFVSTIAIDSGKVIGVVLTFRHFPESVELHLIAIEPASRRDGVGRALIDHVAASLASMPFS